MWGIATEYDSKYFPIFAVISASSLNWVMIAELVNSPHSWIGHSLPLGGVTWFWLLCTWVVPESNSWLYCTSLFPHWKALSADVTASYSLYTSSIKGISVKWKSLHYISTRTEYELDIYPSGVVATGQLTLAPIFSRTVLAFAWESATSHVLMYGRRYTCRYICCPTAANRLWSSRTPLLLYCNSQIGVFRNASTCAL